MLKHTKLLKHDTCYTYALKRTGRDTEEHLQMESNDFIKKYQTEMVNEEDLRVGDILCFMFTNDPSGRHVRCESEILEDGRVIVNSTWLDLHFMVYEGDGLISHAIYSEHNGWKLYEIKMRRLSDGEDDWFKVKIN